MTTVTTGEARGWPCPHTPQWPLWVCVGCSFVPSLCVPAARTSLTCGSTWTRTARSRRITASSRPAASLLAPCAPSNCTTGKSTRWEGSRAWISHDSPCQSSQRIFCLLPWARGVLTWLSVPRVTPSPATSATCVTSASHGGTTSLSTSGRSTSSSGPRGILASGTAHLELLTPSSPVQDTAGAALCWHCLGSDVLKSHFPVAGMHRAVNTQWDLSSAGSSRALVPSQLPLVGQF